ncbi:bifunctional metallophosphatase/5'-nucleotidase [Ornithinimicrobium sp. W1665]|uniref:bifunctional metallophosphatase/5'-nucleotidase n=1 Tax=Ornithinimicrobium sp. W1665 TaxID=3416666 RepID=UPI003CF58A3B
MKRTLALALAAVTATSMVGATAVAAPNDKANEKAHTAPHGKAKGHDKDKADNPNKGKGNNNGKKGKTPPGQLVDVQLLQFSDFHGRLQPEDLVINNELVGTYGGAAYLAGLVNELTRDFRGATLTVSSGDSIGGSAFYSGLFQDEPTIEVLNAMGLDASAVGNHEFDEGVDELFRMVEGGNHPELGQMGDSPYAGADFPYLAANVQWKGTDDPILPPYVVKKVKGVEVGFIGVVTSDTPILVSPGGIADVEFTDEADALNRYTAELQAQGVEAIVGLVHEGGFDGGAYSRTISTEDVNAGCDTLAGPIVDIHDRTSQEVDVLLTGHTHNGFACLLDTGGEGAPRAVAGPGDWGRVLSQTTFQVDRRTNDIVRESLSVENHLVDNATISPDPQIQAIVDEWVARGDVVGETVVGSTAEAIEGDEGTAGPNGERSRSFETPMANLVADSILWGTQENGAQIAFMNVGGVRASLDQGDVTYREAYEVMPFNNILVTVTMTGAQIEAVLNQQYIATRGRPQLALGVSEGFTYTWDNTAKAVVPGTMELNGVPIEPDATYRVSTLNFLQEGGDGFTAFGSTGLTGGPEDLANFVNYIREFSPLTAPGDRVAGL